MYRSTPNYFHTSIHNVWHKSFRKFIFAPSFPAWKHLDHEGDGKMDLSLNNNRRVGYYIPYHLCHAYPLPFDSKSTHFTCHNTSKYFKLKILFIPVSHPCRVVVHFTKCPMFLSISRGRNAFSPHIVIIVLYYYTLKYYSVICRKMFHEMDSQIAHNKTSYHHADKNILYL